MGLRDRASGRTLYVASSAAGRFCQAPAPLNRCTGFFSAPLFAPPPVNSRCVSSSHPFSVSAGRNQIPVHRQGVCPARGGTFSPSLCALCLCSLPPPHPRYDCWVYFFAAQVRGEVDGVASFEGFLPRGNSLVDLSTRPSNDRCFMYLSVPIYLCGSHLQSTRQPKLLSRARPDPVSSTIAQ